MRIWLSLCILFTLLFHISMQPRHFNHISDSGVLRVGYFKSPDVAYENSGEYYGYEYRILKQFADQHKLSIQLFPVTPKTVNYALNVNEIDIAIGSFLKSSVDERFFKTSLPFESQSIIAVEKRQKKVAASTEINFPIHLGLRLSKLPNDKLIDLSIIQTEKDELSLFKELSNGQIKLVGTTLTRLRILQRFYPNIRRVSQLDDLRVEIVWLFSKRGNPSLINEIDDFFEKEKTILFMQDLKTNASKRPENIHYLDTLSINTHITSRLPKFERWFKQAGNEYGLDWITLAAMAYQESKWSADAVSPTKVRGIMQMTTKTAKALGINNRLDPYSTIFGAAKYVKDLEKRVPKRVTGEDRTLIAIGAYNIGFGNILKAYRMARKSNLSIITWNDIAKQLPKLKINSKAQAIAKTDTPSTKINKTYARGEQTVNYVARVREFSKILRYYAAD